MKLVEAVANAVENVKELVREMKDIPKKETKRRELSYKPSRDLLKAVRMMPTPVQSLIIQNFYSTNNIQVHPMVKKLLEPHQDSIDVDFEDEDPALRE